MIRPVLNSRMVGRFIDPRFPAYAAFALSFAFASAIVLGLIA